MKVDFGKDIDYNSKSQENRYIESHERTSDILLEFSLGHHRTERMHARYACNNEISKSILATMHAIQKLNPDLTVKRDEISPNLGFYFTDENKGRNFTLYRCSINHLFVVNEVARQMNAVDAPFNLNCTFVSLRFERMSVDFFHKLRKCVDEIYISYPRREFYLIEPLDKFTTITQRLKNAENETDFRMKVIRPLNSPSITAFPNEENTKPN